MLLSKEFSENELLMYINQHYDPIKSKVEGIYIGSYTTERRLFIFESEIGGFRNVDAQKRFANNKKTVIDYCKRKNLKYAVIKNQGESRRGYTHYTVTMTIYLDRSDIIPASKIQQINYLVKKYNGDFLEIMKENESYRDYSFEPNIPILEKRRLEEEMSKKYVNIGMLRGEVFEFHGKVSDIRGSTIIIGLETRFKGFYKISLLLDVRVSEIHKLQRIIENQEMRIQGRIRKMNLGDAEDPIFAIHVEDAVILSH